MIDAYGNVVINVYQELFDLRDRDRGHEQAINDLYDQIKQLREEVAKLVEE